MTARKDLRTSESDWRTSNHAPRPYPTLAVRTRWPHVVLLVLVALAAGIGAVRAQDSEAAQVLQDRGWHGVGGSLQAQATTINPQAVSEGIIAVWTREPMRVPNGVDPYGHWAYTQFLFACTHGLVVPYALIDDDNRVVLGRHVLGYTAEAYAPAGPLKQLMQRVCNSYGFTP